MGVVLPADLPHRTIRHMSGVGIVVVTFNSGGVIGPCLDSVRRFTSPSDAIVVVDNASQDCTLDEVRRRSVPLIANPENRGFAAAVNQGVRSLNKELVLLLNPDCVLLTQLDPFVDALQDSAAAGAGGKLVDTNGAVQAGFAVRNLPTPLALAFEVLLINRAWRSNPVNWHYRCSGLDLNQSARVEQPAGAFFIFRRLVWERLGGFDEAFFPLWFEDVDFCRRAKDDGYHMYYVPAVEAVHAGGHSLQAVSVERRQIYWYGSLLTYSAKHFGPWQYSGVCLAILVGSIFRMVMGIVIQVSLKPIRDYGQVLLLAGRRLWHRG